MTETTKRQGRRAAASAVAVCLAAAALLVLGLTAPDAPGTASSSSIRRAGKGTNVSIAAAGMTRVCRVTVPAGAEVVTVWVRNRSAATALDAFEVRRLVDADGEEHVLASVAADYSSPVWPLLAASYDDDPVTLDAGSDVWIDIDVRATDVIEIHASGNAAAVPVDYAWRAG